MKHHDQSNMGRKELCSAYTTVQQSITEESQCRNLKAALPAILSRITSGQAVHFTAKEIQHEQRMLFTLWLAGDLIHIDFLYNLGPSA